MNVYVGVTPEGVGNTPQPAGSWREDDPLNSWRNYFLIDFRELNFSEFELPFVFSEALTDAVFRVERLLSNRRMAEVQEAAKILRNSFHDFTEEYLEHLIDCGSPSTAMAVVSPAKVLAYQQSQGGVYEDPKFLGGQWSDYFAVLALGQITGIVRAADRDGLSGTAQYIFSNAATHALETVTYAEGLQASVEAKPNPGERGRAARHARAAQIQNDFIEHCVSARIPRGEYTRTAEAFIRARYPNGDEPYGVTVDSLVKVWRSYRKKRAN